MSITYHVCKYTPVELLTALGGECALLDEAPDACAITQTVIDLAKYLGIASIAEGIENEGQFTKIKMMGCNIGQGFFFAKALSVEELEKRGFVSTGPTIITRDQ